MPAQDAKRKLTAILIADVKGYSLLLGEDEGWAVQTLNAYKEIMVTHIQGHKGRLIEAVGDNILAEFPNAADAAQCAVEAQRELKTRNAELPQNRRMEFRIGINLGDVVEEGEKISGDGVNVTAKIESLSAPGGFCISGAAYDYVKRKLPFRYEYLGEQSVKNIVKPVRVYRVLMEPKGFISRLSVWKGAAVKQWERLNPVVKVIIAAAIGVNALWQVYPRILDSPLQALWKGKTAPASYDKASITAKSDLPESASKEKAALTLPDQPSIAVLPFLNMSEDPKQEFLCDGMTEEIITALSKVHNLMVIARNSTFTYKGKPVNVKKVSEELGVRYVLEGSIQRSADRFRINAQLIDALSGNHLWAQRYERDLKDIFALQDEITLRILTAIRVKLTDGEQASLNEKSYAKYLRTKQGLDCYLKSVEAHKYNELHNPEATRAARRAAEEAVAMCPELADGYSSLAAAYLLESRLDTEKSPRESVEKGIEMAQKAIARDDSLADAHAFLGHLYALKGEYEMGIAAGERAIALSPGSATAHEFYALTLIYAGRAKEAVPLLQKAVRLNPFSPTHTYLFLGSALRLTGRFEEAVLAFKKALQIAPENIFGHLALTSMYSMMGREKEARAEAAEVLRINPKFSLELHEKRLAMKDQAENDKIIDALRKAGLK